MIKRAGAVIMCAKLGEETAPYLSLLHDPPCRSLNGHVVPALVSSFPANFEAMRERKNASNARWGSTKDQTAPEGVRLLCRALRPTTEIAFNFPEGEIGTKPKEQKISFPSHCQRAGLKEMAPLP